MSELKIFSVALAVGLIVIATISYFFIETKRGEVVSFHNSSVPRTVTSNVIPLTEKRSEFNTAPALPPRDDKTAGSVSRQLQLLMLHSTDWRAFALDALKRPREGGYFYAAYVARLCGKDTAAIGRRATEMIDSTVKSSGTVSSQQLSIVERAKQVCVSFLPGEATSIVKSAEELSRDGQDPLINALNNLNTSLAGKRPEELEDAFKSVLKTRDPLVLDENRLLERVMAAGEQNSTGSYWFSDKVYSPADPNDFTAFMFAVKTAACWPDSPCAFDDFLVTSCIVGDGDCGISYDDYVRKEINGADCRNQFICSMNEQSREWLPPYKKGKRRLLYVHNRSNMTSGAREVREMEHTSRQLAFKHRASATKRRVSAASGRDTVTRL